MGLMEGIRSMFGVSQKQAYMGSRRDASRYDLTEFSGWNPSLGFAGSDMSGEWDIITGRARDLDDALRGQRHSVRRRRDPDDDGTISDRSILLPQDEHRPRLPPTTLPPPLPVAFVPPVASLLTSKHEPTARRALFNCQPNQTSSNDEYQSVPEYEVITSMSMPRTQDESKISVVMSPNPVATVLSQPAPPLPSTSTDQTDNRRISTLYTSIEPMNINNQVYYSFAPSVLLTPKISNDASSDHDTSTQVRVSIKLDYFFDTRYKKNILIILCLFKVSSEATGEFISKVDVFVHDEERAVSSGPHRVTSLNVNGTSGVDKSPEKPLLDRSFSDDGSVFL